MKPRCIFDYSKDITYGRVNTNNLIESYHNQIKRMNVEYEGGTISRCSCPAVIQLGIEWHHLALVKMDLKHLEFDNRQRYVE
ncbi:hypothetical protein EC957_010261 [Mortierella hygrophila]|uniref:Uncharacterized protein n=1 Tax=Mortierella hygrophila TaxID=979708 RepID=A0A9P6EWL3_9FUNG|nr:hypothetical protein EC957_010261 [Mortierella hygrophila]